MDLKSTLTDIKEQITENLSLGPKNLIGLDIGLSAVKVVELIETKKNFFKLQSFASSELPEGTMIEDEIHRPDEVISAIKTAIAAAGIKNKNVCIGISGPNTMAKRLQIAAGSPEEVEDQVMWESEQYIPFGVDDSTVSFHVLGDNPGGGTDVIVAAARDDIVESFKNLAIEAGLKVKMVDLDILAMCNLFENFIFHKHGEIEHPVILFDFGSQTTNLIIYKAGSLTFSKEMNIGGGLITEEIQRQMGVSYHEAEDLKRMGDENGNIPEEILNIINQSLETFYSEIKKTLNFYLTASPEENLTQSYITGGTSLVPGLMEGLQENLGIGVEYLNPFDVIDFSEKKFSKDILSHIATQGSIALGLAMRGVN